MNKQPATNPQTIQPQLGTAGNASVGQALLSKYLTGTPQQGTQQALSLAGGLSQPQVLSNFPIKAHVTPQPTMKKVVKKRYLVKWLSLSYTEATWEVEEALDDMNAIKNFNLLDVVNQQKKKLSERPKGT